MQTGYSSAQGQCTGHGGEGRRGWKERRDGLSTANLEGADRARSSERCVCACMLVHMYASCIDVSLILCFRGQQTSTSLFHSHSESEMSALFM